MVGLFLVFEASQPNGATYRIGLGCLMHPKLATMVAVFVRLF